MSTVVRLQEVGPGGQRNNGGGQGSGAGRQRDSGGGGQGESGGYRLFTKGASEIVLRKFA